MYADTIHENNLTHRK